MIARRGEPCDSTVSTQTRQCVHRVPQALQFYAVLGSKETGVLTKTRPVIIHGNYPHLVGVVEISTNKCRESGS